MLDATLADSPPFDRFPAPPCARLLGWRLLDQDPELGYVRIAYEAKADFLNPAGFVQGGLLTAMLDDAMGPAVLTKTAGAFFTVTINMNVSFLAPARAGPIVAEASVVNLGKSIATIEARLLDPDGRELARAISSARLVPVEKAVG